MATTFLYAVRYWVEAQCITPLRTGGADGDVEAVLTDSDGRPFVQGTSLAGAMRHWMAENGAVTLVETLFGSQSQGGRLMVSDARFAPEAERSIRPRLRIDGATGSAAQGGKFDVAQINAGAKFSFQLTWLGMEAESDEITAVERMLSALNAGIICLGGQKSNGFGRVSLSVRKFMYDMTQAQAREDWLNEKDCGLPLHLPEIQDTSRVIFTLTGRTDSLLVKAASAKRKDDRTITGNLEESGRPVLPGSSVKGAVRSRAELIVHSTGRPEELVEELFGREARGNDQGKPGQVRFEDVYLDSAKSQRISRIRINRFTGGVMRGGLFQEEPLCSEIKLEISAPADQPIGCALLLYTLRDLALGLYNLGSGSSVGRGYLRVNQIAVKMPSGVTASLNFEEQRGGTISDPSGVFAAWMEAWKDGAE